MGPHQIQALGYSRDRIGCIGGGIVVLGFSGLGCCCWINLKLVLGEVGNFLYAYCVCVCVGVHTPLIKGW